MARVFELYRDRYYDENKLPEKYLDRTLIQRTENPCRLDVVPCAIAQLIEALGIDYINNISWSDKIDGTMHTLRAVDR